MMLHMPQKTTLLTPRQASVSRRWHQLDAKGVVLGRLATQAAVLLRGKHKSAYTDFVDCGDFVVVTNAAAIKLTGNKLDQKFFYHHSGIPGGFKAEAYRDLLERKGEFPVEKAIKGMLPKGVLGRELLTKLKLYITPDHPHAAQKPQPLTLK